MLQDIATPTPCFHNITNAVFRSKFIDIPDVVQSWLSPHLDLKDKHILDFGCGDGVMDLGFVMRLGLQKVTGVEIVPDYQPLRDMAREQINLATLPPNLELLTIQPDETLASRFAPDVIFSWSVFEHVHQKYQHSVVHDLFTALKPGGFAMIQISPLYYSARGAHFFELIEDPWAHLQYQTDWLEEKIISAQHMRISSQLLDPSTESDFAQHLRHVWSCFKTLNRITGDELMELFLAHGFEMIREYRTDCGLEPDSRLTRKYSAQILRNEQIVLLLRKPT